MIKRATCSAVTTCPPSGLPDRLTRPTRTVTDLSDPPRLNYQHFWLRQLFGYFLHPLISTQNSDLRIADVGTGTGYVSHSQI